MEENQNWKTEFSNSFKKISDLYQFLGWEHDEKLFSVNEKYPIFIPVSLAERIKSEGPNGPLALEFLPHNLELLDSGMEDPIGDKKYLKAPQLIHRYESRALFTPTNICPVHCRYCFRKNELSATDDLFQKDFEQTLSYLKNHPEISEIIFTGGDPLTLSDEKLSFYLNAFSEIPKIKDIRFHTRYPVILPSRIDASFITMMENFARRFRTMSLAIHINHKNEIHPEALIAIKKLSAFKLLSQTVLLKNVNDSTEALIDLYESFIELGIRPYYLHHPDQVKGGRHFYLSLEQGRKLYHSLRKKLPGWALPHYVIDVPGGHGKITAMNPETFEYGGQLLSGNGESVRTPAPN